MNIKLISFLIILFSVLSWFFSSYIFLHVINPNLNNIKTITETREIVIDEKFTTISNLENEITQIVKDVWPWVVNIIITKELTTYRRDPFWFFIEPTWTIQRQVWGWSWFFITKDWYILTNRHVIADPDAKYTVITNSREEFEAEVIALDPLTDLWVLKIINPDREFTALKAIENESQINIWQFGIAIWNALSEFQNSVSLWVISWKNRTIKAGSAWSRNTQKLSWLLQTDAAINPWNSWWPLINLSWEVMWINTAISWQWQWVWFSIPISKSKIDFILKSIEEYWEIKRPFIWINYIPVSEWLARELWLKFNYWAYILDEPGAVVPWSSADNAWLSPGDTILSIDWVNITLENDLISQIQNKIPGDKITLEVVKKTWEKVKVEVILWKM